MANHFSALKNARQAERRAQFNRMRRSRLRHQIRAIRRLIEQKDADGATKLLSKTFSIIDRAAKWGIIKENAASRYKSRIHLRLKSLTAA